MTAAELENQILDAKRKMGLPLGVNHGGARPGAGRPKTPLEVDPNLELPSIGKTEKDIRKYLAAVAEAVAAKRLDLRVADTCISAAKASLAALKQANAKGEIKRLQQMLKQAQALAKAGRRQESADRLGQGETVEFEDDSDDGDEDGED